MLNEENPISAAGKAATATDGVAKPVTFEVLRPQIKAIVTSNAVDMIQAMVSHAKEGQYQCLKYLLELIGLYPATVDDEAPHDDCLAQFLLNRLGIPKEATQKDVGMVTAMTKRVDAVE